MVFLPFLLCLFLPWALSALPEGSQAQLIRGEARIETVDANSMRIEASDRAILHWKEFSLEKGEMIEVIQPKSSSRLLNRVTGKLPSHIDGMIESNGHFFLINQSGIVVGKSGMMNTAGLLLSTLDCSDTLFWDGAPLHLMGNSKERLVVEGNLTTMNGDLILAARDVDNRGAIIVSKRNSLYIAAGEEVTLKDGSLDVKSNSGGTIAQSGSLSAGSIVMRAHGSPYAIAIRHSGTADALSVKESEGKIFLFSDQGEIYIDGALNAKGALDVQAPKVTFESDVVAKAQVIRLTADEEDLRIIGSTLAEKSVSLKAARDIVVGTIDGNERFRIEGPRRVDVQAGRDLFVTASRTKDSYITSIDGPMNINVGRDAHFIAGEGPKTFAYARSISGDVRLVAGRHLFLRSRGNNGSYGGVGSTGLKDKETKSVIKEPGHLTIMVDHAYTEPPEIGPGGLYADVGSRIEGKSIRIFTAKQSQNRIGGYLNQRPFFPGAEYADSADEVWGAYGSLFSSGRGGSPFTIFYKDVWASPVLRESFNSSASEYFADLHRLDYWFLRFDCLRSACCPPLPNYSICQHSVPLILPERTPLAKIEKNL